MLPQEAMAAIREEKPLLVGGPEVGHGLPAFHAPMHLA